MTVTLWVLGVVAWGLTAHTLVNARLLRRPPESAAINAERVSLLLPLRNEETVAAQAIHGLLAQQGLLDSELLVLDDASTDRTRIIASTTLSGRRDARLIAGATPPPGWLGKPYACHQLAAAATGDVLVFVDADVELAADAVARSVALLRGTGLALVSPYPRQLAGSAAEVLVQPLLTWSWSTFLPLRLAERSRRPSLSAANGQLLVVDAERYRLAGGHAGVRDEVIEDVALVRAVKAAGGRGGVADGSRLARCRMYVGSRAVVAGWSKSLGVAFGGPVSAAAVLLCLTTVYVLPWLLIAATPWALLAAAAGPAGRLVSAARSGERPLVAAMLHPLSVLALAGLTVISFHRRRVGTATWKGRPVTRPAAD